MPVSPDVRMEALKRYIFTAPHWSHSLLSIVLLGLAIDLTGILMGGFQRLQGSMLYALPAIVAFLLTTPLVKRAGGAMTRNRSALLALICAMLSIAGSLFAWALLSTTLFEFLYACSLALILALRILVLTAIASYRTFRILIPAAVQSLTGIFAGCILFEPQFAFISLLPCILLGGGSILLIYLIEKPFFRMFDVHVMRFLNAYLAHLTDGSKDLDEFFGCMGQEAVLSQTSLVFRRTEKNPVIITVPNIHPGPMGDTGSTRLPELFHDALEGEVLVFHGCASHDFNLVSEDEVAKAIAAVRESLKDLSFTSRAGRSVRLRYGSVSILAQAFGNSALLVATRAPERTEDLVPAIGEIVMSGGKRWFDQVAFVDAHNSMEVVTSAVHPTQALGREYIDAAFNAMASIAGSASHPFRTGVSHCRLPFKPDEGFGPLGVQVFVVEVESQLTAYILLDGNNMVRGYREEILSALREIVDEAEVMTTDTHVVNSISGLNPIGLHIPAPQVVPHVVSAVREAIADLTHTSVGGATTECRGLIIFGHERIAQLSTTVNTILIFLLPLCVCILFLGYLLSLLVFMLMLA